MAAVSQLGAQRKLQRYMDSLRRELPKLQARFHVQYLGLFGSYVPGDAPEG